MINLLQQRLRKNAFAHDHQNYKNVNSRIDMHTHAGLAST